MRQGEEQTDTSSGGLTGSPAYISPEAAQGEDVTFASDVYGLGCVAYWLLTGRQVFEAPSVMQLLLQHRSAQPLPPSEFTPDLPSELEQLVLRCLAKELADRPRDAIELGKQLASLSLEQCWNDEHAQQWWHINLPQKETSASESDTSAAIGSETRAAPEVESLSETMD